MENTSHQIPVTAKADAYDLLCRAYTEAQDMNFDLFGRREHGFNSPAEYVGYAFIRMAHSQGAVTSPKQETLAV